MSTHTKGPWVYIPEIGEVRTAYADETSQYGNGTPIVSINPWEKPADARLIAAAPELLEIAKAYRNLLRTAAHTDGEIATFQHIESVLLKATGGNK